MKVRSSRLKIEMAEVFYSEMVGREERKEKEKKKLLCWAYFPRRTLTPKKRHSFSHSPSLIDANTLVRLSVNRPRPDTRKNFGKVNSCEEELTEY